MHCTFADRVVQSAAPAPLRVCLTGAAGQIAYSLVYMIAKGDMFGPNQVRPRVC